MSELAHTIIIPRGNSDPVFNGPNLSLKLVVLGSNPNLAEIANTLAQDAPTYPRFVIWYKAPVLSDLQTTFPELNSIDNLKGFSTSTTNKIASKIEGNTTVDFVSVSQAFLTAGLAEFNQ